MSSYASNIYTTAMPMPVPGKDQYTGFYQGGHSSYSVSPPESENNVSSASDGATYSNAGYAGYSTTASYAGSMQGDYDSSVSASGVDFNEYMQERFSESFNPIPLDHSVAKQAKVSGILNDKNRELLELQQKAQARLAKARSRFADGMRDAREVQADLEWSQKKLASLNSKAAKKHPKEYKKARERFPSPEY